MTDDGLPPLREVIAKYDLAAKKSLGQNFLLDLNLTGRIARAAGDLTNCSVIEVGPGPGGLTRALLMHGARDVIAIERDQRCLAALNDIAAAYPGRLRVISDDALNVDVTKFGSQPRHIVNLAGFCMKCSGLCLELSGNRTCMIICAESARGTEFWRSLYLI